jgi:hypothetical protein
MEREGFLSSQQRRLINAHKSANSEWFALARKLNRLGMQLLLGPIADRNDNRAILCLARGRGSRRSRVNRVAAVFRWHPESRTADDLCGEKPLCRTVAHGYLLLRGGGVMAAPWSGFNGGSGRP